MTKLVENTKLDSSQSLDLLSTLMNNGNKNPNLNQNYNPFIMSQSPPMGLSTYPQFGNFGNPYMPNIYNMPMQNYCNPNINYQQQFNNIPNIPNMNMNYQIPFMNNENMYTKPQSNNTIQNSQNIDQCPPQKLHKSMEIKHPIESSNNLSGSNIRND